MTTKNPFLKQPVTLLTEIFWRLKNTSNVNFYYIRNSNKLKISWFQIQNKKKKFILRNTCLKQEQEFHCTIAISTFLLHRFLIIQIYCNLYYNSLTSITEEWNPEILHIL